jgi:membrane associated rhomboid family serine protease
VIRITLGSGVARRVISAPAWVLILVWFGQQFLNGIASLNAQASFTGGIAFWAHVGGFVAGALLVWLFKDQTAVERQRQAQAAQQHASAAVAHPVGRQSAPPGDLRRPGPL